MNKAMILNTVISATLGGIVGGVITYLTVKKAIEARADAEIQDVKRYYSLLRKEDGSVTIIGKADEPTDETGPIPVEVLEEAKRIIENREYADPSSEFELDDKEESVFVPTNIFFGIVDKDQDPNPYVREPHKPFLISAAEWYEEEPEYEKLSLTYFEGDDTLMYENETIMDNRDELVGEQHLGMFGRWSDDKNTVFVRNGNHAVDYEIYREEGEYSEMVLGVRSPVSKTPLKRMREDD